MELVNKQYIKLGEFSLFVEIANASIERNIEKLDFFGKLINTITKHEREKCAMIEDVYISISELCNPKIFDLTQIPISRQTILNASLIALYNDELEIAQKLSTFFSKNEVLANELGKLLDYVLEHSMSIDEYFMGENIQYVYNEREDKVEKRNIYSKPQDYKKRELKP